MWFWIFMFVCIIVVPVMMYILGKVFVNHPPKDINGVYGYRTTRSMKNQETWDFAHEFCGRLWVKLGKLLVFVSIVPMFFVIGKSDNVIGVMGLIISGFQLVVMLGSIVPTERALKGKFDKDGNRRNRE